MTPVNADYYAMMRRWWEFTETRLDFYENKLKAHQDHVHDMQVYHARKDSEQERLYEYQQGQLKIYAQQHGQKVDVYA